MLVLTLFCLSSFTALTGCDENSVTGASRIDSAQLLEGASPLSSTKQLDGALQLEGDIGPGSSYTIHVPERWNGDLALYAHGFIDAAAPIQLPTNDDIEAIRDRLLEEGFAVAYSSYSENGLAVHDGVLRTKQLEAIFSSRASKPDRTFLFGHSLGGIVALNLAEKFPRHYDGIVTLGGMIGGSKAQIDYVGNVRSLFDFFYPGVLPGSVIEVPAGLDLNHDIVFPAIGAIQADPIGVGGIASIAQTPIPWTNPTELVTSIVTALGFHTRGYQDIYERTHEHTPFDNQSTVYSGALPPSLLDAINATLPRYERGPDANNYLRANYEPTGRLGVPMISLHNEYDPTVPVFHEDLYAAKVAASGDSGMLMQRRFARYGHTNFEVEEVVQAMLDVANWADLVGASTASGLTR